MTQLFGFSIEERKKKEKLYSPAPPNNDEGTSTVAAGAYFGQYVDLDGIPKNNNDFELIKKYREIALTQSAIVLLMTSSMNLLVVT